MKKVRYSHVWEVDTIDSVEARCPHCGKIISVEDYCIGEGFIFTCYMCDKPFTLGKPG